MKAMRRWDHVRVWKADHVIEQMGDRQRSHAISVGWQRTLAWMTMGVAYDTTKIAAKADAGRKDMELIQFH